MTPKSKGRVSGPIPIMWIDTPERLQSIKPPELDEIVDTSGDGATQVTDEVGELLIEKYDEISEH